MSRARGPSSKPAALRRACLLRCCCRRWFCGRRPSAAAAIPPRGCRWAATAALPDPPWGTSRSHRGRRRTRAACRIARLGRRRELAEPAAADGGEDAAGGGSRRSRQWPGVSGTAEAPAGASCSSYGAPCDRPTLPRTALPAGPLHGGDSGQQSSVLRRRQEGRSCFLGAGRSHRLSVATCPRRTRVPLRRCRDTLCRGDGKYAGQYAHSGT